MSSLLLSSTSAVTTPSTAIHSTFSQTLPSLLSHTHPQSHHPPPSNITATRNLTHKLVTLCSCCFPHPRKHKRKRKCSRAGYQRMSKAREVNGSEDGVGEQARRENRVNDNNHNNNEYRHKNISATPIPHPHPHPQPKHVSRLDLGFPVLVCPRVDRLRWRACVRGDDREQEQREDLHCHSQAWERELLVDWGRGGEDFGSHPHPHPRPHPRSHSGSRIDSEDYSLGGDASKTPTSTKSSIFNKDSDPDLDPNAQLHLRGGGSSSTGTGSRRLGDEERPSRLLWFFAGGRGKPPTGTQLRGWREREKKRGERSKGKGFWGALGIGARKIKEKKGGEGENDGGEAGKDGEGADGGGAAGGPGEGKQNKDEGSGSSGSGSTE